MMHEAPQNVYQNEIAKVGISFCCVGVRPIVLFVRCTLYFESTKSTIFIRIICTLKYQYSKHVSSWHLHWGLHPTTLLPQTWYRIVRRSASKWWFPFLDWRLLSFSYGLNLVRTYFPRQPHNWKTQKTCFQDTTSLPSQNFRIGDMLFQNEVHAPRLGHEKMLMTIGEPLLIRKVSHTST